MFPPQQKPPMPPQGGAPSAPQPQMAADPAASYAEEPMEGSGGPQPVENIGFNQDIQNVLYSRVQTLSEQEVAALDAIVTPQTYPALIKIFPEMQMIFDEATAMDDSGQGPIQGGHPQQGAAPPSGNPILNDSVSRGLVG